MDLLFKSAVQASNGTDSYPIAYNYPEWIPWIIFAGAVLLITISSIIFIICFRNPRKNTIFPSFVTFVCLTVTGTAVMLIPIDIFTVSQIYDPSIVYAIVMRVLYYSSWGFLFVFAFFLVPFAYFYYEESDPETSIFWRICGALRFTIVFMVVGGLLIVAGLILAFGWGFINYDRVEWLNHIVDAENYGTRAVGFIFAGITLVGLFIWNTYVAYGLAAFPVGLVKSFILIRNNKEKLEQQLELVKDKIRLLQNKYELSGKDMSKRDKKDLIKWKGEKRFLIQKLDRFDKYAHSWQVKLQPLIYPFKLLIALLFIIITWFFFASLIVSLVGRIIYSECGIVCGFLSATNLKYNPFDQLLSLASNVFPLDYILFTLFILFFLFGAVVGLANIGIHLFFLRLYKIRFRNTSPQGLLTACVFLMLCIVVFTFTCINYAPQYVTFGSELYLKTKNGDKIPCELSAMQSSNVTIIHEGNSTIIVPRNSTYYMRPCYMSEIATIIHTVSVESPIMSIAFFFQNWLFILCYLISFFVALIRKPFSFERETAEGEDDEDDETDERLKPKEKRYSGKEHDDDLLDRISQRRRDRQQKKNKFLNQNQEEEEGGETQRFASRSARYSKRVSQQSSYYDNDFDNVGNYGGLN